MARITFNIELDSKPDRNGFTAIMVRLHQKGQKPARLLTNVKIQQVEKHWSALDKKRKTSGRHSAKLVYGNWVKTHIDADALNARIEHELKRIRKLVETWQKEELIQNPDLSGSTLTPKAIADRYKNRLSDSYFDLANRVLDESKGMAYRTYCSRQSAINMLALYAADDLGLEAVNVVFVEKFQDYLKNRYISLRTGKRLAASTINQYIEALNTVHVEVLRLKGHSKKKASLLSPFSDVDKLVAKSAYRAKFDEEAIARISRVKLESNRRSVPPEEAFSVWMLSHLLAGMRHSDVLMLRYMHFDLDETGQPVHLTYTMLKTGNVVSIPIFSEAGELIKRWWKPDAKPTDYLLPFLKTTEPFALYLTREDFCQAPFEHRRTLDARTHYWNGKINGALAEIQKESGLKDALKMHNARHSFADLARRIMQEDGSITLLDITQLLGQRDPRMVMTYIEEMEKQDAKKPMNAIFNRRLKPVNADKTAS